MAEKLDFFKKLNNISESNKEIENIIDNIETQKNIFSEEDKQALLKVFKEEKLMIINKSNEIKKSINMEELLKEFRNKK